MTKSFGDSHQVYLVKTNASGTLLWERNYGGAGWEKGYSVQQTTDGGYVVAGYTRSFGNGNQVYLVKTDASGTLLWERNYGGTSWEEGWSVQQTTDGGYIVAGYTNSFGNLSQFYLIKTNASGTLLWQRNYGGTGSDFGWSVQQTSDGGYIVAGYSYSFGNNGQVYLIKTNASGDTLWSRIYYDRENVGGRSVQQTSDGGYIVAGKTAYDMTHHDVYLLKTNASGDILWTRTYGDNGGSNSDDGYSVQQTSDGGYIVAGYTRSFGNMSQVYLIKTDANGNVAVETPVNSLAGLTVGQLKATPNPFVSFATVPGYKQGRFALYDVSGRKVGTYRGDRVGEGLAPGVYFLRPEGKDSKPLRVVKVR
jgi:hypothetical protein